MKQQIFLLFIMLQTIGVVTANAQNEATNVEIQHNNIKISASENIKLSTGDSGKAYYNDQEIAVKNDVSRGATIVIAASNASERSKIGADYICPGVNDELQIQEAVNYIASLGVGGYIQLTEGDYYFHNGVWFVAINHNKALSITIEGQGSATVVHRQYSSTPGNAQGLFSFGLPTNENISNKYVTAIRNMKYNGHMDDYSQPPTLIQTFATSYTERNDVLETTIFENIVCENVYNPSHVFIAMGSHAIMRSLHLGDAYNGYGLSVVPSDHQQGNILHATFSNCITPLVYLAGGNKSFITNNVVREIRLSGKNIICSENIYNNMTDGTIESLISNNLQVNTP